MSASLRWEVVPFAVDHRDQSGARCGRLVWLRANDGATGVGEACPMPAYSPDGIEDVDRALDLARGDRSLAEAIERLDTTAVFASSATYGSISPSAAFAIETAALDLIGRRRGLSFAELLRPGCDLDHAVAVNGVVVRGQAPEAAVAHFGAFWAAGVRAVKLKVDGDIEAAVEIARAFRDAYADDLELRLDANGAWSAEATPDALRRFSDLGVAYCEQPCPVGELHTVPHSLPISFAADESVANADDLDRLLDPTAHPALSALILKPALLGGLARCVAIADRARARGVDVVVTHMFDGPVAVAAAAELAVALGCTRACGLARHSALDRWGVELPQIGAASVRSAGGPGLGLQIEKVSLEAVPR